MPTARAIELHLGCNEGTAHLEVVAVDLSGERFTIDIDGPEEAVRAEAAFLADQYALASA